MTTLTLDQVRDRIAELQGHRLVRPNPDAQHWIDEAGTVIAYDDHPVPLDLSAVAAMMPEGWITGVFQHNPEWWSATGTPFAALPDETTVHGSGPTEVEARLRLTLAVLEAEKQP